MEQSSILRTPEQVLGYSYAELLRIDFPRIPFPESREQFDVLSGLGWALVQVHLLKEKPVSRLARAVWDFHIGGYQVLDEYLKSRRGRTLSLDEINHVADIAGALAFTIEQVERIDAAYRAAFPEASSLPPA